MEVSQLVEKWKDLGTKISEPNLNSLFTNHLLEFLGYRYLTQPNVGSGL